MARWLLLAALFAPSCGQRYSERTNASPLPSFEIPPASSRPKFRYWLPDASVPLAAVQADVDALSDVSAGGLEFLGFYNQGFPLVSTDGSTYGFGTSAFKEVLRAALNRTAERGLVFDFAVGPNTGAGVPAIPGTEGLAMELVYGVKTVKPGDSAGVLPAPMLEFNHRPLDGWVHEPENFGSSEVVAVVAAQVRSRNKGRSRDTEQVVLIPESVIDVTNSTANGTLHWSAPAGATRNGTQDWVVIAFYQRYTNDRTCSVDANARGWIGNGSWTVDHFSAVGAKKVTDFWDQHLLDDPEVGRLLRQVGMYCMFAIKLN